MDDLPDGAFVLHEGTPCLVADAQLLRWTPSGYRGAVARPTHRRVILITPPSSVEILRTGWRGAVPLLHPSAT